MVVPSQNASNKKGILYSVTSFCNCDVILSNNVNSDHTFHALKNQDRPDNSFFVPMSPLFSGIFGTILSLQVISYKEQILKFLPFLWNEL